MRSAARDKVLKERSYELRQWKYWRRERLEELLAGSYGDQVRELREFLKTMTSASALVKFVAAGPWIKADRNVRAEVLILLDAAIIAQRERLGLQPFDDALPGQPPNVFLILRESLSAT